jgi:hypothetical protein
MTMAGRRGATLGCNRPEVGARQLALCLLPQRSRQLGRDVAEVGGLESPRHCGAVTSDWKA